MPTDLSLDVVFKLVEIISILGGGFIVAVRIHGNSKAVQLGMAQQASEVHELKNAVKELSKLVTEVAVQSKRLDYLEQRNTVLEQRYEELRHGEGFVFPLAAQMRPST